MVVAIGQAAFLKAEMIRPGAVVVDVGINVVEGKLVGDVDYAAVEPVASALTPVPGGVGPMTITMLLHNTLRAARLATAPFTRIPLDEPKSTSCHPVAVCSSLAWDREMAGSRRTMSLVGARPIVTVAFDSVNS